MILNEQLYKKQKLYYHASADGDIKKLQLSNLRTDVPIFYITQNPFYAYKYALKDLMKQGYLYVLKLSRPLEIFNANSKIDLYNYEKVYGKLSKDELKNIKRHDWLDIPWGNKITKNKLITNIHKLGKYEGFYNNEDTHWVGDFNSGNVNFDALGLFITEPVEIINFYTEEEAKKHIKYFKRDINNFRSNVIMKKHLEAIGWTDEMEKYRGSYNRWELEDRGLDIFEDAKYINEKVYKQYQNYKKILADEEYMKKAQEKVNRELRELEEE